MNQGEKSELLHRLERLYPAPQSELNFANDYQLLVSVVLSAQCTDKKVNDTTPELFAKFPDFRTLGSARLPALEKIIRPINYYRTKAKQLLASAKLVEKNFGGKVPRTMEELRSLPGVGQKTANVVLNELGAAQTLPVDTHVFRVARRLGLASADTVAKVEEEIKAQFNAGSWRDLHHWLILHGRRICKARTPLCGKCVLNDLCPSAQLGAEPIALIRPKAR